MAAWAYEYIQPVFVFFWACDERNPQQKQQQHTVPRATVVAAAAAAEVALVVVRTATPKTWSRSTPKTTETGDASRGRLSSDDQNRSLSSFFGPADALLAPWSFLCQFFRACVVSSFSLHLFTYALLTTALWVSRIRRKALKYTVYRLQESSLLSSVLFSVHTALCWSLCTPLVCAVVGCSFFFVLTFLFPTATWFSFFFKGEINKTRTSTSSIHYVPHMIRA